jgi:hypothetical protein
MNFSRTTRTVCSDPTEFSYSPENPWWEETASYHRRRTAHGRSRKSPIFCWQTKWNTLIRDDYPVGHPMSPCYPWKQPHRFLSFEFFLRFINFFEFRPSHPFTILSWDSLARFRRGYSSVEDNIIPRIPGMLGVECMMRLEVVSLYGSTL